MRRFTPVSLSAVLAWITGFILVLVPFHAFITVWLASILGHYTLLRLWKEFLLAILLAGVLYYLVVDKAVRQKFLADKLVWLIGLYALLLLIWGLVPLARHEIAAKAVWYGLLVDLRFLAFFLAVLILAARASSLKANWIRILLVPAAIVAGFAVLEYLVLPYDFLRHFGYGPATISPYETINNNLNHIRVMSTLRGANPLGAYLILPLCAAAAIGLKNRGRRVVLSALGLIFILALLFSFSRSAWVGAVLGLAAVAGLSLKSARQYKLAGGVVAALIVLIVLALVIFSNNLGFEDIIFHTDKASSVKTSSNGQHASAFKNGLSDIVHQPFGAGVGSAGPQSVYNHSQARIAENYFLQIGQEAGWPAMIGFIAICVVVAVRLFKRRGSTLALALLASLIGISFVNLLSHAWADDTLAYTWWGLAGIALAPVLLTRPYKPAAKPS
ncbi:MAG TPA: O-antigen ligase family protein [Candidatus Saccharimonadales bacterium]|nr:O-antigen ligase family protein [Candidatus Saccharimonadales bacterium]